MESKVKYGQEHGPNLIRLAKKLLQNDNLLMLLQNTDLDPLNKNTHPEKIDGLKLFNNLIKVVPFVDAEDQSLTSKIVILFSDGDISNSNYDNENIEVIIQVFCPLRTWLIAGDSIRPFAIMSEIRQSLQDKRINGLGEIKYNSFSLSNLSSEMGCYAMRFNINAFS